MKTGWAAGFTHKFDIGDEVCHRAPAKERLRLTVVEQFLQRCHGGVQKSYLVSGTWGKEFVRHMMNEAELIQWSSVKDLPEETGASKFLSHMKKKAELNAKLEEAKADMVRFRTALSEINNMLEIPGAPLLTDVISVLHEMDKELSLAEMAHRALDRISKRKKS